MFTQAARMDGLASAIFTEIDALIQEEKRKGQDVITLSIGSPDMPPCEHVVEALTAAVGVRDTYGYTLSKGSPDFLATIADWYREKFAITLDPQTEVHSLLGSQDGLAHISLCLANPGDVVLVPDPGYPIYSAGPRIAGAEIYYMPLRPENQYLPDLTAIPSDILRRAKLMILNYPNNPLAAIAPREFFVEVVKLAKQHSFVVCHDFAYSELVFDGYRPDSFLSIPGAKEVAVEFHSLSKTYNMAGCRIGFLVGNAQVIALLGRLKSNIDYGIFAPIQAAAIAALRGPQDCVVAMAAAYQRRRDILVDGLAAFGWHIAKPKGSMFLWAPVPTQQTSYEFTVDLLCHTGVAVVPGIAFGQCGEGYVRIALVQSEERLREAVQRIGVWLQTCVVK